MVVKPFSMSLNGTVKAKSRFGFAVGKEIEVAWELTNLDSRTYAGGVLVITMVPANGQFVSFNYLVGKLEPNEKLVINRNEQNNPLTTNVLSEGFTLFMARMDGVDLQSPPGHVLNSQESFLSFIGKSMEEIYSKYALVAAVVGLIGTFVTAVLQLLLSFGVL